MSDVIACGGCGATSPRQRCIGCMHDFGTPDSAWVREYQPAETSTASLQAEIADLHSMLDLQTDLVDRLLTAVERLGQDIGGERPSAILPLLGPCNDRARTLLTKDKSNG